MVMCELTSTLNTLVALRRVVAGVRLVVPGIQHNEGVLQRRDALQQLLLIIPELLRIVLPDRRRLLQGLLLLRELGLQALDLHLFAGNSQQAHRLDSTEVSRWVSGA